MGIAEEIPYLHTKFSEILFCGRRLPFEQTIETVLFTVEGEIRNLLVGVLPEKRRHRR